MGQKDRCALCWIEFESPWKLQEHLKTHEEETKFSCKECKMTTKNLSYLQTHYNNIHASEGKQFPCDTCNRSFRIGPI